MSLFDNLWKNYPADAICQVKDKKGELAYKNQCAIKLGHTLATSNVSLGDFEGRRCTLAKKEKSHAGQYSGGAAVGRLAQEEAIQGLRCDGKIHGQDWI